MNAAQLLRELLKRADAGDIEAVAIAILYKEGVSASAYSDCDDLVRLAGATAILSHELVVMASTPEDDEEPESVLGRSH